MLDTASGELTVLFSSDLVAKTQADTGCTAWDGSNRWESTDVGIASNQVVWAVANVGADPHALNFDYPNASGILEGGGGETVPAISAFPLTVVP